MASMHGTGNAIWLEGYIHGRLLEEAENRNQPARAARAPTMAASLEGTLEANKKVQLARGSAQNAQWEIKQINYRSGAKD
jgi:hypothetical protein